MSNDKRHNGTQGVSFSVVKKIHIGVAKEKVLIKLRQRTRAYTLDGKLFENANKTIRNTPKKTLNCNVTQIRTRNRKEASALNETKKEEGDYH